MTMTSERVFASTSHEQIQIRPYEAQDQAAVRDLFIRVNRELAPAHLKEPFEAYIALSLREEIDRIPTYYAASRGASFWVAADKNGLVGNFGLEPVDAGLELRRMYVDPRARRQGLGRLMLAHAEFVAREQGHARIVLSTSELQSCCDPALSRGWLSPDPGRGCHDRHQQDCRERPAALPLREANRRGPCLPARRPLSKLRQWRAPAIEWLRREGAGSMSLRQDTRRVVMVVGRGTPAGPTLSTKTLQFIGSL